MSEPRFLDAGEAALVVEFGSGVDPAINERVLALDAAIADAPPEGLRELVPTYRSLMIHYDPLRLDRDALVLLVQDRLKSAGTRKRKTALWTLPCCYELPYAEDLAEMAGLMKLSAVKAAAIHANATYRAYMYGFAPGFTYLGGLPKEIAISRREKPRPPHDSKVILVGGGLSAIATFAMPTGWYVVGRTPERLYAPDRDNAFLMEPGDDIRFEPIDGATFQDLDRRAEAGEVVAKRTAR
ncbi:kinase A inhibitor [Variibacter gotjawalensis]|uniref:Kinase A inhibitor n=1 Tax=Variibacter gotjawalensis TaxID=1333996 RepID=A0A0S3PXV1_9BRAD|nr:allophanate hydrolase subunit 1 [Variibacter gotjawalensis]NIK46620.1 KipI family sensor histidine kinase inhibitor [Variibacter gotjawalensis]RZS48523.1 KipI family sensor histidine kinase inhibitor [Variibacter gotjawalensis]BAT60785.1 kinase A inhibitor [Variibacter gotjawalensis]